MSRSIRLVATVAVAALGLAACDSGGGFDEEAYCKIAREFFEAEGPPSNAQLDRYVEAAPPEIEDDAEFVAGKFKAAEGNVGAVFSDPEVEKRFENISAAEKKRCGLDHDDEGGEEGEPETAPAPGATVVEITGVEYAFEGVPETLPAGLTALGFTNGGEEAHEMVVGKLAEGVTTDQIVEAAQGDGDPREQGLIEEVGGTLGPREPGGEKTYVNAELAPGNYAMFCFVPGPEGKPHAALGMSARFTVA